MEYVIDPFVDWANGPVPVAGEDFKDSPLVVLGTGPTLRMDLKRIKAHGVVAEVMAVNRAINEWGHHLDHFVTRHPDQCRPWLEDYNRWAGKAGPLTLQTHAQRKFQGSIDHVWNFWPEGGQHPCGTSGLFGVLIGLGLGYKRIFLAGIPLRKPDMSLAYDPGVYECWERFGPVLRPYVRSASGWTQDLLGGVDG